MTAKERRRAVERGAVFGLILAGFFGVIGFFGMLIGKWLFDSFLTGVIIILLLALILMGISFWKLKPLTDQSHKDFFASTQWSKEQGLTSDKIVLRRS
jgi:amino acid transporter